MEISVLSLFDGLSGARLAIDRLGWEVKNYYAAEIEQSSITVSKANFPGIVHLGDVCKINGADYKHIDLLIGGSPCQSFSSLVNMTNVEAGLYGKSKLFFEYIRILREVQAINPNVKFILENVASMTEKDKNFISTMINAEPVMIESSLVCGALRNRLYWTNIEGIEQPKDRKIFLKDVLESGYTERDKSVCLTATYYKSGVGDYFIKNTRQYKFLYPVIKYNNTYIINDSIKIEILPNVENMHNRAALEEIKNTQAD